MGLHSNVRAMLPATTRNFERQMSDIHEQLNIACDNARMWHEQSLQDIQVIRERVEPMYGSLLETRDRLHSLEAVLHSLEAVLHSLEAVHEKPSYCNLEYLSLNREYTGRRILLVGWYGASNCGDELMMRTMLQHFEGRGVRVSVLLWDDPDYDFSRLPACADQIHYPRSTWELRQLSEYFDVLVWGGGAIIDEKQFSHDPKNINTGNLFIWLSEEMQKRGKDVYAVGLSANDTLEAGTEFSERLAGVIKACRLASMRDEYSLDTLAAAGVDISSVKLCEDIVFGNKNIGIEVVRDASVRTVGVVLMMGDVTAEHNRRVLPRIVETLHGRFGSDCRIKLIPFYNFWKFDVTLLGALCDELGISDDVEIAPYTDDLHHIALLGCDVVVAYRYHACLVAAASQIPTLFMCVDGHPHYRNKMRRIAELFGMSDNLLMASTCLDDGSFDARFSALLDDPCLPQVPADLFADTSHFLDQICSSIVEP